MTTFSRVRGKGGVSAGADSFATLTRQLATFPPSPHTTVRNIGIDWGIDLLASDNSGDLNSSCSITIGLTYNTTSSDSPVSPGTSPGAAPNDLWLWWQGAWATSQYNYTAPGGANGAFAVNGRIDHKNYVSMSTTEYTTWWLIAELDDGGLGWTTFKMLAWWNFLTAPTVS